MVQLAYPGTQTPSVMYATYQQWTVSAPMQDVHIHAGMRLQMDISADAHIQAKAYHNEAKQFRNQVKQTRNQVQKPS